MMFIDELYQKSVAENEKNLKFWEDYLNSLKSLDFDVYAKKLKVPILVPIGKNIFFRGELKHTNEVTVSLGADYFVKCSITQAEVLKQRRITDAQSKVNLYMEEKEYLEKRISFTKENIFEKGGQEIVEVYSEEEDKVWRAKHRENVKKYKQSQTEKNIKPKDDVPDAELWERLEELELEEELENELLDNYNEIVDKRKENTFLEKEEALLRNCLKEMNDKNPKEIPKDDCEKNNQHKNTDDKINIKKETETESNHEKETSTETDPNEISECDLLQRLLFKQMEFETKIYELNYKQNEKSTTEEELIAQLDDMEQLDELEDEIERLDDILGTEDVDTEDSVEDDKSASIKIKKSICFADQDDGETLEITFSHTNTKPKTDSFDPKKGIRKPSDLYEAFSQLFDNKTTSILKKPNYGPEEEKAKSSLKQTKQVMFKESTQTLENLEPEGTPEERMIVINDVVENVGVNQHMIKGGARPTSLFKKKRMQNK